MDTKHFPRPQASRYQGGLTLVEAAVVVAVAAIVAASAAPSFSALIEGRRIEGAASRLATDIGFVRSEAAARQQPLRLSLHSGAGTSCWVVHTGAANQCRCVEAGPALCTGGAREIKTVVLGANESVAVSGNVSSIVFDPLHGTNTPTGTLRLVGRSGRAIHHVVNVMGRVRSCSPGAAMTAYPAC